MLDQGHALSIITCKADKSSAERVLIYVSCVGMKKRSLISTNQTVATFIPSPLRTHAVPGIVVR